ncbi:MAG TPA: methyltransferase domain-containing protein [Solirubrobacteraceae bacterium]|jgi:ubiquinone/menaquinone biosynthesis C-methylase UbiE|nr:methyltransferase domain-containing protein [Solirubrobacteraceae bacterium]
MTRNVSLRELIAGVEGLALLRNLYDGTDEAAGERLAELRRVLDDPALGAAEATPEHDAASGYAVWSDSYDEPGNPVIAIEQAVVGELLAARPSGTALDAACGTGRHARTLVDLGHTVEGFDLTPEMIERARVSVPEASFEVADLRKLRYADASFQTVVCGLALAHLPELEVAIAELSRVLAGGGQLIISVLHPFQALLGWNAPFSGADGSRGFVREHPHLHADYLAAFASSGLQLSRCVEPTITESELGAKKRAFRHIPEATAAAYLGLPAVLVLAADKP